MSRQIPATIALAVALLVPMTACAPRGNSTAKETSAPEGFITADDGVKLFYRKVGNGPQTVVIPGDLYLHPAFDRLAEGRSEPRRHESDGRRDDGRVSFSGLAFSGSGGIRPPSRFPHPRDELA